MEKDKKASVLYKVGEHYESHYDDDDCTFLYYNAEDKCLQTDEWTTRFACDSYYSYQEKDIQTGIDDGTVVLSDLANAILAWLDKDEEMRRKAQYILEGDLRRDVRYNLPCEVKGGRKYKGSAVLIDVEYKPYSMGYGRTGYQHIARLLTPDNTIAYATDRYVRPTVTEDAIVSQMKANLYSMSKATKGFCNSFLQICGSGTEFRKYREFVYASLFPLWHEYDEKVNAALKADEEAKQNKHLQWLKERRVGLLGWCRTTFEGKSEDEIQCICDRIMKKKYGETLVTV